MEIVGDFGEAVGGLLVACFVKKEDLDIPTLHGETFHLRRLVTNGCTSAYDLSITIKGPDTDEAVTYMLRCSVTSFTVRFNYEGISFAPFTFMIVIVDI
jgi:hypothetical protein